MSAPPPPPVVRRARGEKAEGGLEPDQKELFPPTTVRLSSGGPLWKFSLFLLWYTQVQQIPDCNWLFKTGEANGIKGETSYLHLEEKRRKENNMLMRFFSLSLPVSLVLITGIRTRSTWVHTYGKQDTSSSRVWVDLVSGVGWARDPLR